MRQAIILNGRTCKGSSYWLTSPPDLRSRSIVDAAPFRLLQKYSIGMPLIDGPHPLKCPDCGSLQDKTMLFRVESSRVCCDRQT